MVPIEPSHEQLFAAGVKPDPIIEAAPGEPDYVPVAKMIYRAMIANAPAYVPPVPVCPGCKQPAYFLQHGGPLISDGNGTWHSRCAPPGGFSRTF